MGGVILPFVTGVLVGFLVGGGLVVTLGWGLAEIFGRRKQ